MTVALIEIKGSQPLYLHAWTPVTDDGTCGWVGTEAEMEADFTTGEARSNWICPKCGSWERLENYETLSEVRIEIAERG